MLTSLYRSLTRHRLFALLNIGGLALGIATFLVLFLFVRFETGFDRVLPDADQLWIVSRTLRIPGVPDVAIPPPSHMLADLRADYPDTIGTRMQSLDAAVQNGAAAVREKWRRSIPTSSRCSLFRQSRAIRRRRWPGPMPRW